MGPEGRYGAVLFLEKEGFTQILEAAQIAERYDIAIMSTKGMSVTAARILVEELCGRRKLPLFVLHDFDLAGFSIKKTLTESGERFQFPHKINFIDLGLRLTDVEELGLEAESVNIREDESAVANRLRINGATPEEIAFLLGGERVELNAMPSDQFIAFVERKLTANGVAKVVPSAIRWPRPSPPSSAARWPRRRSRSNCNGSTPSRSDAGQPRSTGTGLSGREPELP